MLSLSRTRLLIGLAFLCAALHPAGLKYRALPAPGVTRILPNPVRDASLTTTALVAVDGPDGRTWAAAMPAVAAVEPLIRTAATTARAAQDVLREPPACRKVNFIDATAPSSRILRPHPGPRSGAGGGFTAGRRARQRRAGDTGRGEPERPRLSG